MFWTQVVNTGLFQAPGRWNPLLRLVVNALLHAGVAGVVTMVLGASFGQRGQVVTAAVVAVAMLPLAAWHNALCGFQSQVIS